MNSGKRDRDASEPSDGQEGSVRNRPRVGDDSTGDGGGSVDHGDPNGATSGEGGTFQEGNESSENSFDDEDNDVGSIFRMDVIRRHFASHREVNQFELSDRLDAVLERIPLTRSRLAYSLEARSVGFDDGWQEFRLRRKMDTLVQEGWTFADLVEEVVGKHRDHVAHDRLHFGVFIWLNSEVVLHVGGRLVDSFASFPVGHYYGFLPILFSPLQIQCTSRTGFTIPAFDVLAMSQEGVLDAIPGVMHLLSAGRPMQILIWAYGTTMWTFNSQTNTLGQLAVSKGFTNEFLVPGKSLGDFLQRNPQLKLIMIWNDPGLGVNQFNLEQAEALIHYVGDNTDLGVPDRCREAVVKAHTLRKNLASLRGDLRAPLVGLAIRKVIESLERLDASYYATSLVFILLREQVGLLFGNRRLRGQPRS